MNIITHCAGNMTHGWPLHISKPELCHQCTVLLQRLKFTFLQQSRQQGQCHGPSYTAENFTMLHQSLTLTAGISTAN